jgi:hypothetical protein
MRKLGTVVAMLTLAIAGLAIPATTAQADDISPQGPNCDRQWPGPNGNMYAWRDLDCTGERLGVTPTHDLNWADGSGPFTGSDNDAASSVMNAGRTHEVAFYRHANWDHANGGYGCLARGELYADDLRDNYFWESDSGRTNVSMHDNISSHQWVTASGCAAGSWIT